MIDKIRQIRDSKGVVASAFTDFSHKLLLAKLLA